MEFCQFPAQGRLPVAEGIQQIGKGRFQAVGGLVEDEGSFFAQQLPEAFPAFGFIDREESLEYEASGRQAADGQGGDQGAAARHGLNGNAAFRAQADQVLARVADSGRASVGNQGAGLTGQETVQYKGACGSFIVFMVADHGLFEAQVAQEFHRYAGILGGDKAGAFQGGGGSWAKILQVANRRCHQVKNSVHCRDLLFYSPSIS